MVLAQHHQVWGYDVSERPWRVLYGQEMPNREEGLGALLDDMDRRVQRCDSIGDVVKQADIIFVAVQTPHAPEYGGDRPRPGQVRDFEYAYLVQACRDVCNAAREQQKQVTLAVVSTVLPGTTDRLVRPLLGHYTRLAYTPQFIAMGTTIADFSDPEFVICGTDDPVAAEDVAAVFSPVHEEEDRTFRCDITTAESIKVFYNTFISMKVVWANAVMEMCHGTGADCDLVVDALTLARDRVISPKYMRGGMGDGGACHPRDLIALEFLEERLGTSYPLFQGLRFAREEQTKWLAGLVKSHADQTRLPVILLGRSYKPSSDLIDGSPAILLEHYLRELEIFAHMYDPYIGQDLPPTSRMKRALYVLTTRHPEWQSVTFPPGSVVLDIFGYIEDQPNVTVVRVGRR
jgi:UDPglucose 6-dehydrogenase